MDCDLTDRKYKVAYLFCYLTKALLIGLLEFYPNKQAHNFKHKKRFEAVNFVEKS